MLLALDLHAPVQVWNLLMLYELSDTKRISPTLQSDLESRIKAFLNIRRFTTEDEIDFALETIKDRVMRLRAMSPFLEDDSDDEGELKVEWVGVGSNQTNK